MDLYTIYRKNNQEELPSYEDEYLDKIADQYAYFTLPHYLKAKHHPSKENIFTASAYSVNRKLLKKYLDGKLFFTELPQEEQEVEKSEPEPVAVMLPDPQYQKPLHHLFSIIDFTTKEDINQPQEGLFSIAEGITDTNWTLPFISWDLEVRIRKHSNMAEEIKEGMYHYEEGDFPVIEKNNISPEPTPEKEETNDTNKKKAQANSLIDQFLAAPSSIKRKRVSPSEAEAPSIVHESITEDEDLVTETLARLHLLQNNPEEAIRIYQKLRLLFPEKSAYFDAQINKIKER